MYLEWSDNLNVGVEQLDDQHREMVDILNEMYVSMDENQDLSVVCEIGERLVQCTKSHFEVEEELMQRYGYPVYQEHFIKHAELSREIQTLLNEMRQGKTNTTMNVIRFFRDWLNVHIIYEDKKVGAYLSALGCD